MYYEFCETFRLSAKGEIRRTEMFVRAFSLWYNDMHRLDDSERKYRMNRNHGKKQGVVNLILCALALAFTVFVFAPVEQYMLNQSEMWFNLGDIVPACLLCFVLLSALIICAGMAVPGRVRRVLTAVVLALALCLYLQGNFLNPDYGELDGRAVAWSDYTLYGILDTAFWIAVIIAMIWACRKHKKQFRRAARYLAAALLIIQGATLAAVLMTRPVENRRGDWIVSDRGQFVLGQDGNMVVFVVDACDLTYYPRILAEDPDALEELDGFTWYSDYAGSYSKTKMGLPYTLTGRWYENDQTIEDYIDSCYRDVPLYGRLREAGWNIRLYTAETYMSRAMIGTADNVIEEQLTVGSHAGLFAKMMEFVGFRYAPHPLKPMLVFYSGDFGFYKAAEGEDQPYFKDNYLFREKMERDGLSLAEGRNFTVYHINGSHLPCNMDEYGKNVGNWNMTAAEQTKGVLRTIIGPYLKQMKELGVYDSACIIITADHGRFDEGPSSPILLLKPAGASGPVAENAAMASVSDLHATLLKLCGLDSGEPAVWELPQDQDRVRRYLYYPTTRGNGGTLPPLTEYHVERGQQFVPTGTVLEGGKENIR